MKVAIFIIILVFPFISNAQKDLASKYQCNIQLKKDKLTGSKEYNSQLNINDVMTFPNFMFYKKNGITSLSSQVLSDQLSINKKGLYLLFDDNAKIYRPNTLINLNVSKLYPSNFEYSCDMICCQLN